MTKVNSFTAFFDVLFDVRNYLSYNNKDKMKFVCT